MTLHVVCSGCLKRFQVSKRFAGMEGPCPNCGNVIPIPKNSISFQDGQKIHSLFKKNDRQKDGSRNVTVDSVRPIPHISVEWEPLLVKRFLMVAAVVLFSAFLVGYIPMYDSLRSFLGILGLCLIVFPLVCVGYRLMRNQETIFIWSREELVRKAGIISAGYVLFWLVAEYLLNTTKVAAANPSSALIPCLLFLSVALLATLFVYPILKISLGNSFLHFCLFAAPVVLLRYLMGIGWLWESSEWIHHTPPPILPGMY